MAIIAASIIAIAAVIGILFWGMSQGKELADMGYTAIMDTNRISSIETVQTFTERENKGMPAAACYNLLKANTELISKMTCNICGKTTIGGEVGDCLKNHIKGRIKITLTEEENSGTYTAILTAG